MDAKAHHHRGSSGRPSIPMQSALLFRQSKRSQKARTDCLAIDSLIHQALMQCNARVQTYVSSGDMARSGSVLVKCGSCLLKQREFGCACVCSRRRWTDWTGLANCSGCLLGRDLICLTLCKRARGMKKMVLFGWPNLFQLFPNGN